MKIKKSKRLLALILCMALVLGTNTFTMAADASQSQEEIVQDESTSQEGTGTEEVQTQGLEETEETVPEPTEEQTEEPGQEETQGQTEGTSGTETEETITEEPGTEENTLETVPEENGEEVTGETPTDITEPTEGLAESTGSAENTGTENSENPEDMTGDEATGDVEETQDTNILEEQEWSQQVGDTLVKVKAAKGTLPEEAVLSVSEITAQEDMDKIEEAVEEKAIEEKFSIENILAYDIKFMVGDTEVQPEGTVQVTVDAPEITSGQEASVLHLKDDTTVEDMNGAVDTEGQVVFDTTHFSTYVIVNEGDEAVTIKIQHLNLDGEKIYSDDDLSLNVGETINNYAKATNWEVDRVVVNEKEISKDEFSMIQVTQDSEIKIYYKPKESEISGQVKFYDYTVKAGQTRSWGEDTYYSFNMLGDEPNDREEKLTAGTADQNYENYKYHVYTDGADANAWTGNPGDGEDVKVVHGLLKGVTDGGTGDVEFNYPEPGFFEDSDATQWIRGERRYLRHFYNNYTLNFDQEGDTYTLVSVNDRWGTQVATAGSNFYPLDNVSLDYESANTTGDDGKKHNLYFGMRYDVTFKIGDYIGPLNYNFSGDDDLWVVLDGETVVIDLGGIHNAAEASVDLWDYIVDPNGSPEQLSEAQKNQEHRLTVLYMERGAGKSNCSMNFTLPSAEIVEVSKVPMADFQLTKVNSEGIGLPGAEFELVNQETGATQTAISNESGNVSFTKLREGTYTLTETKAPDDYILPSSNTWVIKVTAKDDETAEAKMYLSDGETEYTPGENGYQIVNYTQQEEIERNLVYDKWVTDDKQNGREYTIHLTADSLSHTEGTEGQNASIVLVLDRSGSMGESGSMGKLRDAAKAFVDKALELSPNSEIALVSFSTNSSKGEFFTLSQEYESGWGRSQLGAEKIKNSIDDLNAGGSTYLNEALEDAYELISEDAQNSAKYVITFTDGAPGYSGEGGATAEDAYEQAKLIKGIATHYTIAYGNATKDSFDWDDPDDEREKEVEISCAAYLNRLATEGKAYTSSETDDLTDLFEEIAGDVAEGLSIQADEIVDVIDARFELTEETKDALRTKNEELKSKNDLQEDCIIIDDDNEDGTTIITWKGPAALIASKGEDNSHGWAYDLKIKAKDDFIGGNMIPTNGAGSGIDLGDKGKAEFPKPTVNVKLLNLKMADSENKVFLGDTINPVNTSDIEGISQKLLETLKMDGDKTIPNLNVDNLTWDPVEGEPNKMTATVDYSYQENPNDVIGTFTFTFDATKGNLEEHVIDKVGESIEENVEEYVMTVEYTSKTVQERQNQINGDLTYREPVGTELTANNNDRPITVSTDGTYGIKVVAGKVEVTKHIDPTEVKGYQGEPIFTFKLTRTYEGKTQSWYESVKFSEEDIKAGTGTKTVTFENLPKGTYTVEEVNGGSLQFKQHGDVAYSVNTDDTLRCIVRNGLLIGLEKDGDRDRIDTRNGLVSVNNKHSGNSTDTDNDIIVNRFKIENGKVVITPDELTGTNENE